MYKLSKPEYPCDYKPNLVNIFLKNFINQFLKIYNTYKDYCEIIVRNNHQPIALIKLNHIIATERIRNKKCFLKKHKIQKNKHGYAVVLP